MIYIEQITILPEYKTEKTDNTTVLPLGDITYPKKPLPTKPWIFLIPSLQPKDFELLITPYTLHEILKIDSSGAFIAASEEGGWGLVIRDKDVEVIQAGASMSDGYQVSFRIGY
jgi:hypothetical protein